MCTRARVHARMCPRVYFPGMLNAPCCRACPWQAPFTKDSMDKLFTKAAKLLPPNIQKIYGGDGGQWVGLKAIFFPCLLLMPVSK